MRDTVNCAARLIGERMKPEADQAYIPISCSIHDELLAAVMAKEPCELDCLSESGTMTRICGRIVDVYSRVGAEYLQLEDGTTLRLDRLRKFNGKSVHPA
ncbi:hypothetical protein SAMN05660860_01628 [Geoalkalibacter ferrihydriticus]|nr:hypothetical protein SAMN05660860_01628 [Geoalkalibacter ferrihydriticus]